jgi:hypothetical protein
MAVTVAPIDTSRSRVTALYLGAEVDNKLWFPVKKMVWREGIYHTGFVGGVKELVAAAPLWRHYFKPEAFSSTKMTHEIHCDYACRMPLDRPQEMPWHLPSLGLSADLLDPIAFTARSGGYRETDSLDIFPEVQPETDGSYRFYFLLRKLYLVNEATVNTVIPGDVIEAQDWWAVHQPTGEKIGILPGYIRALLKDHYQNITVEIERVNHQSRIQRRLLCSAICKGFTPFESSQYTLLGD